MKHLKHIFWCRWFEWDSKPIDRRTFVDRNGIISEFRWRELACPRCGWIWYRHPDTFNLWPWGTFLGG